MTISQQRLCQGRRGIGRKCRMGESNMFRWLVDEMDYSDVICVICGKVDSHYNMDHEYTADGALWNSHICRDCSIWRALFFINRIGLHDSHPL